MKKLLLLVFFGGIALLALFVGTNIYHEQQKSKALLIIEDIQKEGQHLFATGRLGDYPVLICSYDNGQTWQRQTIRREGIFPPQSSYKLRMIGETVWIHEYQPCIECDFSNKLLGIYYSHNSGKTWQSMSDNYRLSNNHTLIFHTPLEAQLTEHINEKETNYVHTEDGGKKWIEGALKDSKKPKKKKAITVRSRIASSNSNEYIIEWKPNGEWTYLSRIDRFHESK